MKIGIVFDHARYLATQRVMVPLSLHSFRLTTQKISKIMMHMHT